VLVEFLGKKTGIWVYSDSIGYEKYTMAAPTRRQPNSPSH